MDDIKIPNTIFSLSLVSICTYLWIDYKILWLYIALMSIDFITWVIRGFILKNLRSSVAINWVFKKLVLIFLIFSVWVTGKIMGYEDLSRLMSFAFSTLAIAELYSILSNIYEIRTWKTAKEFDWVTFLVSAFMKLIESKIQNLDTKDKNNDLKP